ELPQKFELDSERVHFIELGAPSRCGAPRLLVSRAGVQADMMSSACSSGSAGEGVGVSGETGLMTSATTMVSSGSTPYSRERWYPRRATFSVRMERGIMREV